MIQLQSIAEKCLRASGYSILLVSGAAIIRQEHFIYIVITIGLGHAFIKLSEKIRDS